MDEIELGLCGIYGMLNVYAGGLLIFLYCAVTNNWDVPGKTIGLIVGGTFAVLSIVEFLCWLFHIPEWIGKGILCIREKTDPEL